MKAVLFLNPPHLDNIVYMKEIGRCGRKSIAGEFWPQIGLAYLAAIAKTKGFKTYLWDGMLPNKNWYNLSLFLRNIEPFFIVMLTSTPTFKNDLKIAYKIRELYLELNKKVIISMVGTHSSVFPEEALISNIDVVFINEAEKTLSEILEIFKTQDDWKLAVKNKKIKSIAIKSNGSFYINKESNFIENLDLLPFPARELMDVDKYTMPFFGKEPFTNVIPSRGCPYNCIFCRAGKVWGKKIRLRSVNNVISEIKEIIEKFSIKNIIFMTDSFTFDRNWVIDFCKKIIDEKIKIRWICNSRVDTVDDEMLYYMKKAGCVLISYGIESADEKILKLSKKNITIEDAEKAIKLTKKYKIISFAYFIIGLPGETEETIKKTFEFAKKLKPDYVNFHIATPFPGTEFYDFARKNNFLISNNWEDFEEEGSAVISYPELPADKLLVWQKKIMRKFYLSPYKIFKELSTIKSFSELFQKLKAAYKLFKLM